MTNDSSLPISVIGLLSVLLASTLLLMRLCQVLNLSALYHQMAAAQAGAPDQPDQPARARRSSSSASKRRRLGSHSSYCSKYNRYFPAIIHTKEFVFQDPVVTAGAATPRGLKVQSHYSGHRKSNGDVVQL